MLKHSIVQRKLGNKLVSFMAVTPLLLRYVAGLMFEAQHGKHKSFAGS